MITKATFTTWTKIYSTEYFSLGLGKIFVQQKCWLYGTQLPVALKTGSCLMHIHYNICLNFPSKGLRVYNVRNCEINWKRADNPQWCLYHGTKVHVHPPMIYTCKHMFHVQRKKREIHVTCTNFQRYVVQKIT